MGRERERERQRDRETEMGPLLLCCVWIGRVMVHVESQKRNHGESLGHRAEIFIFYPSIHTHTYTHTHTTSTLQRQNDSTRHQAPLSQPYASAPPAYPRTRRPR